MKNIYFVIPSMSGGGAEKVLSTILKHIDRNRFRPALILFIKGGDYLKDLPADISVIDLGKKNRWDFLKIIFRLRQVIKKEKPDVLVSFLDYTNIIVVLSALFLRHKPGIVISEHSYHRMYLPHARLKFIRKKLMHFTYSGAARIISVSGGMRDALVEDFKVDRTRVEVIYNPIDIKRIQRLKEERVSHKFFDGARDAPVLISAGRLERAKNFDLLIRAFAAVREKSPACLIILGQGKLKAELKRLAVRLGVGDYIDFVGFQTNPFAWMSRSDIFILSSSWEGFGNVIVESMACGTPVISTDCPVGPGEIIKDRENGILVPVDDPHAMSKAILELIENEELRNAIANRALSYVEKFDIASILPQYWRAIDEVLNI